MKKRNFSITILLFIISFNTYSQKEISADKLYNFTNNYAIVEKGDQLQFIDTLGNINPKMKVYQIINSIFSNDYGVQGNDIYITRESGMSGVKNISGKYIFEPNYDIEVYHDFFILKTSHKSKNKTRKLIVIDKNGKIIYKETIPLFDYKKVLPLSTELIAFSDTRSGRNNLFEIKNINTNATTGKVFTKVNHQVNGLIKVRKYNEKEGAYKWGFINLKFETIIDFIFSKEPGNLIENRILVKSKDKKFGYIHDKGKLIIEPKYIEAYNFVNGKALVKVHHQKRLPNKKINNGYRFIDLEGKIIKDFESLIPSKFSKKLNPIESNGIVRVKIRDNGYLYTQCLLNIETGELIKTKYDIIYSFNSGFAVVRFKDEYKKRRTGYINKKGELVLVKALESKF